MTVRSVLENESSPTAMSLLAAVNEVEITLGGYAPTGAGWDQRALFACVLAASLALHATLARGWLAYHPLPRRIVSEVEVLISRPPPPPPTPVVIPPQAQTPPPATPLPRPAAAPVPVIHEPQAVQTIDAPVGDDGTLPAGPTAPEPVVQAPVAAPPAPPVPVVAAREGANYLHNPRPAYPHIAQREGWEGVALLRVRVKPDGRADSVTLQKSTGRSILDDAALKAVADWTFAPATQGGVPIAGWVTVPIEFRLQ